MISDWIKNFFEQQTKNWDLARNNFRTLQEVKKKPFNINGFKGFVQFNPARAVSTLANIDNSAIKERKCFLCKCNRPESQKGMELIEGWELLVNPYPILPYHFTIVNKEHFPQKLDFNVGCQMAEILDGMVVFYNDAGAGASAPDHAHYQAVPIIEVPLIKMLEDREAEDIHILNFPFYISDDLKRIESYSSPVNCFFWKSKNGEVKFIGIPRKSHRPALYYLNPPDRRAVSPGALDMSGVMITPFENDFNLITEAEIQDIYSQVGFTNE